MVAERSIEPIKSPREYLRYMNARERCVACIRGGVSSARMGVKSLDCVSEGTS